MRPEMLRSRREAVRLTVAELARLAGVDKHTIHRIEDAAHSPVSTTLDKIETALVAEERRVLAHLLRLHPLPSDDRMEPAPAVAPDAGAAPYLNGRAA